MPHEANIKKMRKDLDEEMQQSVVEEMGNAGEPNAADLHTIMELFEKFTHTFYNIDPNSTRAYSTSATMHNAMREL